MRGDIELPKAVKTPSHNPIWSAMSYTRNTVSSTSALLRWKVAHFVSHPKTQKQTPHLLSQLLNEDE